VNGERVGAPGVDPESVDSEPYNPSIHKILSGRHAEARKVQVTFWTRVSLSVGIAIFPTRSQEHRRSSRDRSVIGFMCLDVLNRQQTIGVIADGATDIYDANRRNK